MINNSSLGFCYLPMEAVNLPEINVQLSLLKPKHKKFYLDIYQNPQLMRHIKIPLSLPAVESNFNKCLQQLKKIPLTNINYIIKSHEQLLGILGLKAVANNAIEFGIIIDLPYQNKGWSKKIKQSMYAYLFEGYGAQSIVAYCDESNVAANHINQQLGFELIEHKYMPRFNRVIKKWLCSKKIDELTDTNGRTIE